MTRGIHIGLNYTGSPYELAGCANDARAIKQMAQAAQASYTLVQFQEYTGAFSANRLFDKVLEAGAVLRNSDTLYLSFSGHGTQIPTANGTKEAICLWNGKEIEVVLDTDFRALLSQVPCNVVAVLDSCFSGGMSRDTARRKRRYIPFDVATMPVYDSRMARVSSSPKNRTYFMLACQAGEVAYEFDGMGDFTRALQAAVKGTDAKKRAIKNLITKTRDALEAQTPMYDCIGGNAAKRVF